VQLRELPIKRYRGKIKISRTDFFGFQIVLIGVAKVLHYEKGARRYTKAPLFNNEVNC
jgi:hypothetical protein